MARVAFMYRMWVKEGREAEYVERCKALQVAVKATEPDTLYYEFFKLREPRRYCVVECFTDAAAEELHMNSAAVAEHGPGIVDCLAGPYEREALDPFEAP